MRLRAITSLVMVLTAIWFASGPWIIGTKPTRQSPRAEIRRYAQNTGLYVGVLLAGLIASGVGATLVVRRARNEYREQSTRNFKDLLEGTRQDHRRPTDEDAEAKGD